MLNQLLMLQRTPSKRLPVLKKTKIQWYFSLLISQKSGESNKTKKFYIQVKKSENIDGNLFFKCNIELSQEPEQEQEESDAEYLACNCIKILIVDDNAFN